MMIRSSKFKSIKDNFQHRHNEGFTVYEEIKTHTEYKPGYNTKDLTKIETLLILYLASIKTMMETIDYKIIEDATKHLQEKYPVDEAKVRETIDSLYKRGLIKKMYLDEYNFPSYEFYHENVLHPKDVIHRESPVPLCVLLLVLTDAALNWLVEEGLAKRREQNDENTIM